MPESRTGGHAGSLPCANTFERWLLITCSAGKVFVDYHADAAFAPEKDDAHKAVLR